MMLVRPLICTERLGPESLGSRIPVILPQAGAGPGGIGVDPTGIAAAPEVLPGGSDCGRGAQAGRRSKGLIHSALFFRQQCRSETMAYKDLAWSQGYDWRSSLTFLQA